MNTSLLNIIQQLIESLIVFYFFESISTLPKEKAKRFLIIILSYLVMTFINLKFNYNAFLNIVVLVFFLFCFGFFLYKKKVLSSLFYSLTITCIIGISEFSVINIIEYITGNNARSFISDYFSYILQGVFSKTILFFILVIIVGIINSFKTNEKFNFSSVIYLISLFVTLIDFILISYQYDLNSKSKLILSTSSVFLISAIVVICIVQQKNSQKERELIELKAIQQKQDIENTYFDLLEHQNEELQIFVHDMQKHLGNIYNLSYDSNQIKEYISALSTDLCDINKIGKTSNKLLDLIIDKYNYISQKKNIIFEKNIHFSDLSFIKDNDLTSIFNNLLDNAVEAASQSTDKKISFSINSFSNILTVSLLNSCDRAPVLKNNALISTKKKEGLHGYGIKSITKTVKKYNGDVEWEYDESEHIFSVSILFQQ